MHMAPLLFPRVLLLLVLLLTTFPGNNTVKTFSHLSVRSGGSISIPCFYHQKHRNQVKYWCKGKIWTLCHTMVRTDTAQREGKVSISDDPHRLVFTVTMRDVQEEDSGRYWCAVEIGGAVKVDVRTPISLQVTSGVQDVRTESWMLVQRRGSVSIPCYYDSKYRDNVKYWCKGYYWALCSTMVRTDSPRSKGKVSIADDPDQLVFTVTMTKLQEMDAGTYWCAVEIAGGSDEGVFLQLMVKHATRGPAGEQNSATEQPSSAAPETAGSAKHTNCPTEMTRSSHSTAALRFVAKDEASSSTPPSTPKVLPVLLGLTLFLTALLVIFWTLRSRRKTQTRNRDQESSPTTPPAAGHEDQVAYSTVIHKKPATHRGKYTEKQQPSADPTEEVTYSSVAPQKRETSASKDVIYTCVNPKI